MSGVGAPFFSPPSQWDFVMDGFFGSMPGIGEEFCRHSGSGSEWEFVIDEQ